MTNEEKELLLRDLCARLPYGVQCKYNRILPIGWKVSNPSTDGTLQSIEIETSGIINVKIDGRLHGLSDVKPYLRPMKSMTEEEIEELQKEHLKDEKMFIDCIEKSRHGDDSMRGKVITYFAPDWCDKKMFDYRGLIQMGLALPAKEGMYAIK